MGYTHYWTQRRNFTRAQWETVSADLRAILTYAQHDCGIPLANGMGDGGTAPEFDADSIAFNGLGDDGHETFIVRRVVRTVPYYPGEDTKSDFCKTARKPYDDVVTACLCYLSTMTRREDADSRESIVGTEAHVVSSDGHGADFLAGLDLARKALPRLANELDLPLGIMQDDRWCAPWVGSPKGYQVRFCLDGCGYILKDRTGEAYCFESHVALAQFLDRTKVVKFNRDHKVSFGRFVDNYRVEPNIWGATGSFDTARHERIARAQMRVLAKLFPVDPACAKQPPAFARSGQMPENAGRKFCYSLSDLLNLAS